MAMKSPNPMDAVQAGVVRQSGRFRPNGSSAVDASTKKGLGYTPSRVDVGHYRLTFDKVGQELLSCSVSVMANAVGGLVATFGAYDATNKTLDIFILNADGAAAADPASHANSWIAWSVDWQNASKAYGA